MGWLEPRNQLALEWLLDAQDPGVRYLALRDLTDCAADAPELAAARAEAHRTGPIRTVLEQMDAAGFWVKPGHGYNPKYRSTVWALTLLGQLGASLAEDERIGRACAYALSHTMASGGMFSTSGTPSGTIDCLQGNLCAALYEIGYDDPRLIEATDWMARTVTGEGIAPNTERDAPVRYYQYKCGPGFACGVNDGLPCAWGAIKVMLAFSKLPAHYRTPQVERAIQAGIEFLFTVDPALATYPSPAPKPNASWFKFGFPVFYVTDVLQNVEALTALGYGHDPRLAHALEVVRAKQDADGRWRMEYEYTSKTWVDFGLKKQPNKWVTLRALRALRFAELRATQT
ncbi:MAG: nitrogen fixation protein NifH [Anaerolineales bacterium]|nr:nitrogen fixation protein NifH [Anaerolineales bacterium]